MSASKRKGSDPPGGEPLPQPDLSPEEQIDKASELIAEGAGAAALNEAKGLLEACVAAASEAQGRKRAKMSGGDVMHGRALLLLGKIEDMQGRPREAVKLYDKALQCLPGCVEALVFSAQALRTVAVKAADLADVERRLREAISQGSEEAGDDDGAEEDVALAKLHLAQLLLESEGGVCEAQQLLTGLGFNYRLADGLLQSPAVGSKEGGASAPERPYVRVVDGALPGALLEELRDFFLGDEATFWEEHRYESPETGYFSYAVDLPAARAKAQPSLIERAILHIHQHTARLYPEVGTACVAEWWAHRRPHPSGHQLHFDTDEARLRSGQGLHTPIVSTVTYLSRRRDVGGLTVVFDHPAARPGKAGLAEEAVAVDPRENRLLAFDGRMLHGVLPGRGCSPDAEARRLTLMVGFWSQGAEPRSFEEQGQGPMRSMPRATDGAPEWAKRLEQGAGQGAAEGGGGAAAAEISLEGVRVVSPCWVKMGSKKKGGGKKGAVGSEAGVLVDVKASGRFFLQEATEIDDEMEALVALGQRAAQGRQAVEGVRRAGTAQELGQALEAVTEMVEDEDDEGPLPPGLVDVARAVLDQREAWMAAPALAVTALKLLGSVVERGEAGLSGEMAKAAVEAVKGREGGGEVGEEAMALLCGLTGSKAGSGAAAAVVGEEGGVEVVVRVLEQAGSSQAAREGAAAVLWNLGRAGAVEDEAGQVGRRVMAVWDQVVGGARRGKKSKQKQKKRGSEEEEGEEQAVVTMLAGALAWLLVGEDGRCRKGREGDLKKVVEGGGREALQSMAAQEQEEDMDDDDEEEEEEAAEALGRLEAAYARL